MTGRAYLRQLNDLRHTTQALTTDRPDLQLTVLGPAIPIERFVNLC